MKNLLIHSMSEFASLILPALQAARVRTITEIGSEFGGGSRMFADYCAQAGGMLTCIDPEPQEDFAEWAAAHDAVAHIAQPSHSALPECEAADAWVVDGDHNYYTVAGELRAIDAANTAAGRPLLVFLHDVSWPCARRDMYYAPERIPPEWRQLHSYEHGVNLEGTTALFNRGFRGMGQFSVALEAGGPRNGVLTAVEDFLSAADTEDRPLCYVHVPAVFGLGVIFDARAEWAETVANLLAPFHENDLIARLEENRLRNYLRVIELQDQLAAAEGKSE
jgi:hypothetical protein